MLVNTQWGAGGSEERSSHPVPQNNWNHEGEAGENKELNAVLKELHLEHYCLKMMYWRRVGWFLNGLFVSKKWVIDVKWLLSKPHLGHRWVTETWHHQSSLFLLHAGISHICPGDNTPARAHCQGERVKVHVKYTYDVNIYFTCSFEF